jgi:hypothetical protein
MPQSLQLISRVAAVTLAVLLSAQAPSGGQTRSEPRATSAEARAVFRVGERLDYQIGWANFLTAATATLLVPEQRVFEGRTAWHFRARASTVEFVRFIYELDDQYDSYSDAATLASLQYEEHQRHQKRNEQNTVRMSSEPEPASGEVPTARVPPGTRDPLGAFYSLRTVDWQNTRDWRANVYDGKTLYELRARVVLREELARVPAGNFRAAKIEIRLYERGREVTDTRFWLWLALDARRTPVRVEALLPFGTLSVELKGSG